MQPRYAILAAYGDGDRRVYQRLAPPAHVQEATLGNVLGLVGYDCETIAAPSGTAIVLRVTYRTLQPVPEDLLLTARVESAAGVISSVEQPVGTAALRATQLRPGDRFVRQFNLPIPPVAAARVHSLHVGVKGASISAEDSVALFEAVDAVNNDATP